MKIYAEFENGSRIAFKELSGVSDNCECLLFFVNVMLRDSHIEEIESELTQKIGKKCIVVDYKFEKVLGI